MPYKDKETSKEYHAKYYKEHKKRKQELSRAYYLKNSKRLKAKFKQRAQEKPEEQRNNSLKRKGWSEERFSFKMEEQEGKCAICGTSFEECRYGVLQADHKHTVPPIPRGLLCNLCNVGLGAFKDNPEFLEEAIKYLRKYSDASQETN